jgi:hypothetical protein
VTLHFGEVLRYLYQPDPHTQFAITPDGAITRTTGQPKLQQEAVGVWLRTGQRLTWG